MRKPIRHIFSCAIVAGSAAASADSIAIDGRVYENVLVYEGNSAYYVKIPDEGRVISAPKGEVSAASVSINDDPYYRDRLKTRFDQVRSGDQAAQLATPSAPSDPAFQAPDTIAVPSGGNEAGGVAVGGGGSPLGVTRQAVESMLQSGGWQNQSGAWKSANGSVQVQILGPDDNVTSVVASMSGPMGQIMQGMGQVNQLVSKMAPWAPAWVQQASPQLMQTGFIENAQNGVYVSIAAQQQGPAITLTATVRGA
ncbi:MAG: hypothetical protein WD873_03850 [Candidatus Hydrogenedentales bacterium]